jgi:hypothetical protein
MLVGSLTSVQSEKSPVSKPPFNTRLSARTVALRLKATTIAAATFVKHGPNLEVNPGRSSISLSLVKHNVIFGKCTHSETTRACLS